MEIGEKVKSALFSKAPNSRISKLGILDCFIHISATAKTDLVANLVELGHVETFNELQYDLKHDVKQLFPLVQYGPLDL